MSKLEASSPEMDGHLYAGDNAEEALTDAVSGNFSSSSPPKQSVLQGSFTPTWAWPQNYSQAVDVYSHTGSPATISSLSPHVSGGDLLCLPSSYRGPSESTQDLNSLSALLLPSKGDESKKNFVEFDLGITGRSSTTQGVLNGINVLCGVGILSTPYALKEGGWSSLGLFVVLAIIYLYTGALLRHCLGSQPGLETYPDIGHAAFGVTGRVIICIVLYMEQYASCVDYLILEGDNLSSMFPNASLNLLGFTLTARVVFSIIATICVLPTVWLRNLSLLSYISAAGVVVSLVILSCVTWIGVVDGVGFHHGGSLLKISTLPVSVGIYGFCFAGHSVFPNIYSSLRKPSHFSRVLIISFLFTGLVFGGMAVVGFTMFGNETQSQITLNLPSNLRASKIAMWCTIITPFTKYALSMTPVALSLEDLLLSSNLTLKNYGLTFVVRTMLVLSTLLVALLVPFFADVMALIGSFPSMLLCLIFPAAFFLKLVGYKASKLQKFCCIAVMVIGVVCCCVGTYASVAEMIGKL